jgi:polyhomeotic-like protein 2
MHMQDLAGMGHHFLSSEPTMWYVDDVYEFICSLPGCQEITGEFRGQEINGQALLLLKEDHLMSAINIKLGPPLKIYASISMLKEQGRSREGPSLWGVAGEEVSGPPW